MTDEEKLTMLRTMIASTEPDEVLFTFLHLAGRKIIAKAFPYKDHVGHVPGKYDYLQVEIAAYMLNKRGAEGQTAHTENGVQRQYENADVPASMLSAVVPHVGVL